MDKQIILDAMVLRQAVQRVRELHKPLTQGATYMGAYCAVCHEGNTYEGCIVMTYPCPTIKALDGDS